MGWSAAASFTWRMNAGTNARYCAGWRVIGDTGACLKSKDRPAHKYSSASTNARNPSRRALEEVDPEVETFSSAGYFGIAVDYKGIDDPQGAAFCPVVVKPQHAVIEQSKPEDSALAGEAPLAQAASRRAHAAVVLIVAGRCCAAGSLPALSDCSRPFL